ncbi:MAG: hypothetical protein R3F59_14780 [Myxococcota bacterium]
MRPPVVLVHGFLATPQLMLGMRWRLERAGHQVFPAELGLLAVQDVRQLAGELDATVDKVRYRTGAERVSLVGVSQGGIIALWWAHHREGWARTASLVAVGAPFRGSWAAVAGLPWLWACSRGIWQLLPGAALLDELVQPLPDGARLTTVSLRGDPVSPPGRCAYPGADNRVLDGAVGPLNHQWLTFDRGVTRAVVDALSP